MDVNAGRRIMSGYLIDGSLNDGDACFQGPLVLSTGKGTRALFTSAVYGDLLGVHPWHPALPAVAAWLATQPEWINPHDAMARLHKITQLASAKLFLDGDFSGEIGRELTEALDDPNTPHDWECIESLIDALAPSAPGGDE